jgi:hypothetical protein
MSPNPKRAARSPKNQEEVQTDTEQPPHRRDEEAIVVEAVAIATTDLAAHMTALGFELTRALTQVGERLAMESRRLAVVHDAVAIETKRLAELHALDAAATSVAMLVREHEELQLKQQREREEYDYQRRLERQRDFDTYSQQKRALERALAAKQEEYEREWAARESEESANASRVEQLTRLLERQNAENIVLQKKLEAANRDLEHAPLRSNRRAPMLKNHDYDLPTSEDLARVFGQ